MMRLMLSSATLAVFALGCSSGPNVEPVSGTVTLKGQKLDRGTVTFLAASGNPYSTEIKDGAFGLAKEKGLPPGTYKVSIDSPDGKTPEADPNAPPGPGGNFTSKNRVPAEFNTKSKLEVEVRSGQPNQFTFDIP